MKQLILKNIYMSFRNTKVLSDFNLTVDEGKLVCLLGPSGCGKTTLLRIIAGLENADGGEIIFRGEHLNCLPPQKRKIGFVFQYYALFPNLSALQNISFGLEMNKIPKKEARVEAKNWLKKVGLEGLENRYPHELSGGQQQRVALARTLAPKPEILLLDEPLSALDASIRVTLRNEIRRLQQELGITSIFVTHDQSEALAISDIIFLMNKGTIVEFATPEEMYSNPKTFFSASFIGTSSILKGNICSIKPPLAKLGGFMFRLLSLNHNAVSGVEVKVVVRPENIHFIQPFESEECPLNHLHGRITSINFIGTVKRCEILYGDGRYLTADIPVSEKLNWNLGQAVCMEIKPEHLHVYSASEGTSLINENVIDDCPAS
jgi:putative spermidine/putrescine transport system ATP-binding protein